MEKIFIKKNFLLRVELEKEEFIKYFISRLQNVDVSGSLYDITYLLVQSAEEKFYKKNKKLGKIKKEAVISVLSKVIKTNYDEKVISGMIESILTNNDVKRVSGLYRVYMIIKSWFLKSDKK
jgi:hypothetical protein